MILSELIRLPTRLAWAVGLLILLAIALILIGRCGREDEAAAARSGQALAEAGREAARDASAIRDRADDRDHDTAETVNAAEKEIRDAPDRTAASDAARRRVCQLTDYRDPGCAVLRPDPGRVD